MFVSENPFPNSSVSAADATSMICFPYSALVSPFCSSSTIRCPILQFLSTKEYYMFYGDDANVWTLWTKYIDCWSSKLNGCAWKAMLVYLLKQRSEVFMQRRCHLLQLNIVRTFREQTSHSLLLPTEYPRHKDCRIIPWS